MTYDIGTIPMQRGSTHEKHTENYMPRCPLKDDTEIPRLERLQTICLDLTTLTPCAQERVCTYTLIPRSKYESFTSHYFSCQISFHIYYSLLHVCTWTLQETRSLQKGEVGSAYVTTSSWFRHKKMACTHILPTVKPFLSRYSEDLVQLGHIPQEYYPSPWVLSQPPICTGLSSPPSSNKPNLCPPMPCSPIWRFLEDTQIQVKIIGIRNPERDTKQSRGQNSNNKGMYATGEKVQHTYSNNTRKKR